MFQLPNTRFHTDIGLLKEEFSNHDSDSRIYNVEGDKSWTLKFLQSPTAFVGGNDFHTLFVCEGSGIVNKLEGDVRSSVAIPEIETIETGLVNKSVCYRSLPVEVFCLIRAVAC